MTQHTTPSEALQPPVRSAGRSARSVLLLLVLTLAAPARAHHGPPGSVFGRYDPCEPGPHDVHAAHGESRRDPRHRHHHRVPSDPHERPHQHNYTHTHWHTHVLEDDTVVHHSHPHSHTYWHHGPDETEEERVTRVLDGSEIAAPTEEGEDRSAGTTRPQDTPVANPPPAPAVAPQGE